MTPSMTPSMTPRCARHRQHDSQHDCEQASGRALHFLARFAFAALPPGVDEEEEGTARLPDTYSVGDVGIMGAALSMAKMPSNSSTSVPRYFMNSASLLFVSQSTFKLLRSCLPAGVVKQMLKGDKLAQTPLEELVS